MVEHKGHTRNDLAGILDLTIGRLAVIRSFTVKSFRGFSDLTVEPLERVNLIAGMNNLGKTSLLEAIYLHENPDQPRLIREMNEQRGFGNSASDSFDNYGWMFPQKLTVEAVIKMKSQDKLGCLKYSDMLYLNSENLRDKFPDVYKLASNEYRHESFKHTFLINYSENCKGVEREGFSFCAVDGERSLVITNKLPKIQPTRFLATRSSDSKSAVSDLSKMRIEDRLNEILPVLEYLEPRIRDLSLEVTADQPAIYASVGIGRLIPIAYLGEGMRRLLSIVLAIANSSGGAVFIDEIENGLHHSVLPKIWKAIGDAAKQSDVQVFATTHSYECIRAAHEAFSANDTYDLGLFRLVRLDDRIKAVAYDKETLGTAVEMNLEVR